jgi:hypothetical protein
VFLDRRRLTAIKNAKRNFDDLRDYMDRGQDIPAGQLPTVEFGPIAQFLNGMPDWMNMNQEGIDLALAGLPIPLKGPLPPGISLQEAIQVNQRHDRHNRQYQIVAIVSFQYTI